MELEKLRSKEKTSKYKINTKDTVQHGGSSEHCCVI